MGKNGKSSKSGQKYLMSYCFLSEAKDDKIEGKKERSYGKQLQL